MFFFIFAMTLHIKVIIPFFSLCAFYSEKETLVHPLAPPGCSVGLQPFFDGGQSTPSSPTCLAFTCAARNVPRKPDLQPGPSYEAAGYMFKK